MSCHCTSRCVLVKLPSDSGTPAAGRKKRVAESRYKTRELSEGRESVYRFDEKGNPVDAAKKKAAAKTKKKSSEPAADGKSACADDEPCSDKGHKSSDAEADAL